MLCERTRGWASLALDDELSEFERSLLLGHVERCADCAAFLADLRQFTAELRAAEPVQLARPIGLPAPRRVAFRTGQLAAAAAVVLGAIGLGTALSGSQAPAGPAGGPITSVAGNQFLTLSDSDADSLLRISRLRSLVPAPQEGYAPNQKFLEIPL